MRAPFVSSSSLPSACIKSPCAAAMRASWRRGSCSSSGAPASTRSPSATSQRSTGSASSAVTATRSHSSEPTNGGLSSFAHEATSAASAAADNADERRRSTRMGASEAMLEQSERVSFERRDVDVLRVEQPAPDGLRREREQRETDERYDEQPRIEVRAHGAFVLQRRKALHEHARHALGDVLEQ